MLAQQAAMSPKTLARHVQRATGKTPMALIQSVRLRRARTLLENTRMPVEQVAAAVGYQDATALRRLLLRLTDATPRQYRRAGS
jgi:transcriptional regulator GlxA family with amidase domain